jgi:hypothetical protein
MLIRSAVEIESLIGELYKTVAGSESGTIGEKLKYLNNAWVLEEKRITITTINMHFSKEYSGFAPFKYKSKDNNDYYHAYNSVKHNRAENFEKKATLHYLLRALAALFILNIYHQDKTIISLGQNCNLDNPGFGSDIFSVHSTLKPVQDTDKDVVQNLDDKQAIYIIKMSEMQYSDYQKVMWGAFLSKRKKMADITNNGHYNKRKFETNFIELAKEENFSEEQFNKLLAKFSEIDARPKTLLSNMSFEAMLNKGQVIYPAMSEEDK